MDLIDTTTIGLLLVSMVAGALLASTFSGGPDQHEIREAYLAGLRDGQRIAAESALFPGDEA